MVRRESLVFMDVKGIIMDIEFNAFEAFEIAERIERNGAKFYSKAAELFDEALYEHGVDVGKLRDLIEKFKSSL